MENMENIGGLWLQESKNGIKYFSGKINNQKILIFKNKNKKSDNHPDYLIYTETEIKQEKKTNEQKINDVFNDNDIPF